MNLQWIFFILLPHLVLLLPSGDLVTGAPGFINTTLYSGYLNTSIPSRRLHYVFIQSQTNSTTAPLTVWLNGGPGCSSLIGMIQQIGPYLVGNTYIQGDLLIKNQFSWNKVSNLLFIESPGIVGFSTDTNYSFQYTDNQTADDTFEALKYFLFDIGSQFKSRQLYLTGESYAGKYIPDLAVRILDYNIVVDISKYINLKGLLIGNGVMKFQGNSLTKSQMEYMAQHDFLHPRLGQIYRQSCSHQFQSPRCKFRQNQSLQYNNLSYLDVYQICQGLTAQSIKLAAMLQKMDNQGKCNQNGQCLQQLEEIVGQIKQCPSDQGAQDYFNKNTHSYHVFEVNKTWTPCSSIHYTISPKGSMTEYKRIFLNKGVRVWLFSGDWDSQVPFPDTVKNLKELGRKLPAKWDSWFVNGHHSGFYYEDESLVIATVKSASHMVPQTKPRQAYQMYYNFLKNRSINQTVPR